MASIPFRYLNASIVSHVVRNARLKRTAIPYEVHAKMAILVALERRRGDRLAHDSGKQEPNCTCVNNISLVNESRLQVSGPTRVHDKP